MLVTLVAINSAHATRVIVFMPDDLPPELDYDYAAECMPARNLPATAMSTDTNHQAPPAAN